MAQKDLKSRIGSVKNIQKITRAMEMVAAARLRRAEQRIENLRPYAGAIRRMTRQAAAAAENIPYYIQHLVAATVIAWRATGKLPRAEDIPRFVDTAIEDRADPWDLKHYRNRLSDYYGTDATAVGRLLDVYAHAPGRLTIDDALTRTQGEGIDITDRV